LKAHSGATQAHRVAEPGSPSTANEPMLSRWSRLKRAASAQTQIETPVGAEPRVASDVAQSSAAPSPISADAAVSAPPAADRLPLPPLSAISLTEDFTPFMQAKVPQALKQQALKALFKAPHFNAMDGLDIYIDDYTVFEPITPEVMATLSSWKSIMNPPKQVVTPGGYAVDVESDEGKTVLAAQQAAQQAAIENAPLQVASVSAPPSAVAEPPAVATAPAAVLHPRHGKRVGEFVPTPTQPSAPAAAPNPVDAAADLSPASDTHTPSENAA
jgi:Protein of unknown function (DUF3306)